MSKVVIIGAGHAAGQVVASLLQRKFTGNITLLGEEAWHPYQRPPLSKKFLAGEIPAERLLFKPQSFYDHPNIDVQLKTTVTEIDRANQSVGTACGRSFDYDHLVIATGSRPRKMTLPGVDLAGIHYLRNIDDVDAIRADVANGGRLVIVGAGYIGLEVAAVTAQLGLDVAVVEMQERVMSRVVAEELSRFYQDAHTSHGVVLRLSTGIESFSGTNRVDGVVLDGGEILPADAVVIGIGIVPNIELAAAAGLEVSEGVVVDDHCQTSDSNIYAIGDCTWHPNSILNTELRLESVHNALEQAKTAAGNICGDDVCYAQVPWFWSDQYDLKLQIAGISQGYDQTIIRGSVDEKSFACLYLRNGVLIAVDAVNNPKDFVQSKALISAHAKIDPDLLADNQIPLKDLGNL